MKMPLVVAVVHLLAACTTPEQRERDKLTDLIEARVKLPKGAGRLADYARHYALDDKGLVMAVYSPGYVAPNPDDTCEEMFEDFTSREVPCTEEPGIDRLLAGQRRWVDDTNKLPLIMDGECSVVTFIYDTKQGVFRDIECNGPS